MHYIIHMGRDCTIYTQLYSETRPFSTRYNSKFQKPDKRLSYFYRAILLHNLISKALMSTLKHPLYCIATVADEANRAAFSLRKYARGI